MIAFYVVVIAYFCIDNNWLKAMCASHFGIEMQTQTNPTIVTKHCCWELCKSDSRYPERLPPGTIFIRFSNSSKICDNVTEWEKQEAKWETERAKC